MATRRPIGAAQGLAALAAVRGTSAADTPGDRDTLRTAVKYTLQLLAERAPGHSVEVRVPPLAAIQAIPGPAHRRGTPSAVVELDPATWLALATGTLTWEQANTSGRVRASGERADLTAWLPLVP
jgi:hypothetical protein